MTNPDAEQRSMRERHTPGLGRLWFGVAAAPIAWSVAELVGYVMVARSCEPGWNGLHVYGEVHPRPWMIGLALLLALVAASGLWTAVASMRATAHTMDEAPAPRPGEVTTDRGAPWTRARFMAVAGVFVSTLFLAGTVLFGIPSMIVNGCAQIR